MTEKDNSDMYTLVDEYHTQKANERNLSKRERRELTKSELSIIYDTLYTIQEIIPEMSCIIPELKYFAFEKVNKKERDKYRIIRAQANKELEISIDFDYFSELKDSERAGVLLHEIFHVLNTDVISSLVKGKTGPLREAYNFCQELEINSIIFQLSEIDKRVSLPDDVVNSHSFKELNGREFELGLSSEEYWELIKRFMKEDYAIEVPDSFRVIIDEEYFNKDHYFKSLHARYLVKTLLLSEERDKRLLLPSFLKSWAEKPHFIPDFIEHDYERY